MSSTDPKFAEDHSTLEYYSKIGDWHGAAAGNHVLEVGCGSGRYVAILSSLGCDVTGVDPYDFDTWSLIKKNCKAVLKSDIHAESLPFDDNSFDAVSCLGALLYFDDPDKAISEMYRVLRPQGHLIIKNVNRKNLYTRVWRKNIDPASKNTYTKKELIQLVEHHGFNIRHHFAYGFYPPVLSMYWWYLVNGVVSLKTQKTMSDLIPPSCRVNDIVFAQKVD